MRMRRFGVGLFLVLHGLAHAAAGTAAQDAPRGIAAALPAGARELLATLLFIVAMPGFVAAGFGVWGTLGLRRIWAPLTSTAVLGSALLLALYSPPSTQLVVGLGLDAAALALSGAFSPGVRAFRVTS